MQTVLQRTRDYYVSRVGGAATTTTPSKPRPRELRIIQSIDVIQNPVIQDNQQVIEVPVVESEN